MATQQEKGGEQSPPFLITMATIKILGKGFPTTHYGFLKADTEYSVDDKFAKFCVERMKAAEYVTKKATPKETPPRKSAKRGNSHG